MSWRSKMQFKDIVLKHWHGGGRIILAGEVHVKCSNAFFELYSHGLFAITVDEYVHKYVRLLVCLKRHSRNGEWCIRVRLKATWKAPINLCLPPRLWDTQTKIISLDCWRNFFECLTCSGCGYFWTSTSAQIVLLRPRKLNSPPKKKFMKKL